ncbi:MAG: hypothetical protein QXL51_00235 [Candidatus Aenigmatarchaeota archaeon]
MKYIKDPYWDYENDILNDFSRIELSLSEFSFSEKDDSLIEKRRFAYRVCQKVIKYVLTWENPLWVEVFFKYFVFGKSQVEIGEEIGKTQAYVSHIVKKIREKILIDFRVVCKD